MRRRIAEVIFIAAIAAVLACFGGTDNGESVHERTEGDVTYVERFDSSGRKTGTHQIFVGDWLSAERTFARGHLIEHAEYLPDGSVRSRITEDESFQLRRIE